MGGVLSTVHAREERRKPHRTSRRSWNLASGRLGRVVRFMFGTSFWNGCAAEGMRMPFLRKLDKIMERVYNDQAKHTTDYW